eukprot:TRINITY_DN7610_c0_g1_i1.p1 TRINITY_DN7610_c0_g1~~TRINITY_DN7610_c0_g1_i1.p1  ORF type:complete len:239 (+),score=43.34 TRINITY_DN7610_c0_g1_i1:32-748(+)
MIVGLNEEKEPLIYEEYDRIFIAKPTKSGKFYINQSYKGHPVAGTVSTLEELIELVDSICTQTFSKQDLYTINKQLMEEIDRLKTLLANTDPEILPVYEVNNRFRYRNKWWRMHIHNDKRSKSNKDTYVITKQFKNTNYSRTVYPPFDKENIHIACDEIYDSIQIEIKGSQIQEVKNNQIDPIASDYIQFVLEENKTLKAIIEEQREINSSLGLEMELLKMEKDDLIKEVNKLKFQEE